jgi:hypothetical protein
VQRNIRLNHVALLPANRGRAGRDVKLLLDSEGNVLEEQTKIPVMADESNYALAQKERADALEREAKAKNEAEALKGELAALKAQSEQLRADAAAEKAREGSKIAARVALVTTAKKYLPELRVDSTESDDAIKRAVIAKINPALKCDEKAEPAYVDGVFRSLVASASQDGGRSAVEAAIKGSPAQTAEKREDAGEDTIAAARARCHEFGRTAWTLSDKEINKLANKAVTRHSR